MKARNFLIFLWMALPFCGLANSPITTLRNVKNPELAKASPHVVKKSHSQRLEVIAFDKVILYDRQVWTVFDEKGEGYAALRIHYDEELDKVKGGNITGVLYDARGKRIDKLGPKDIVDLSANDGSSVMTSNRLMGAMLSHHSFPYTVEYTYKKTLSGIHNFSAWVPQAIENLGVESASLEVSTPKDFQLFYHPVNTDIEPLITTSQDGGKKYLWRLNDLEPVQTEPLGAPLLDKVPLIYLSSNQVKMGKTIGDLSTWEGFGKLYHDLNAEKSVAPDQLKSKVKELTQDINDPKEKVKVLYEYMQASKRYVSIQLGIGGWQSFDAGYVHQQGFGDCKALSNYMLTMLKEVGINAYPTLIKASRNPPRLNPEIVHDPFNHVILCVPMPEDTIWLECTSSVLPFNYLGSSTRDRYALLATPDGGKLVRTPSANTSKNQQIRFTEITLHKNGSADASVNTLYTGYQQEAIAYIAETQTKKDQEDWIKKSIDLGNFELGEFSFSPTTNLSDPGYQLNYKIGVVSWATRSGPRIFLKPNRLAPWQLNLPESKSRNSEIIWSYPFADRDSIVYHLPEELFVESAPENPIQIESEFGVYELKMDITQPHKLIFIRNLKLFKGRYPAEDYTKLQSFFKEIIRADKVQIVLSDKS